MITTITLNPSIDKTLTVESLQHNTRVFYQTSASEPGGKGINISKVLNSLKMRNRALVLLGGENGKRFEILCKHLSINILPIKIIEETRENITLLLTRPNIKEYKINAIGPLIRQKEIQLLQNKLQQTICSSDWITIGGSLPPGLKENIFTKPLSQAFKSGTKIIYDGESKSFLKQNGSRLFLIKPNRHEIALLSGAKPKSLEAFAAAARKLLFTGVENILLTLDAEGALWINSQGIWHAKCPKVKIQSSIGAGDSSIAGVIAGWNHGGIENALALAVACGTATAMSPGSSTGDIKTINKILSMIKIRKLSI